MVERHRDCKGIKLQIAQTSIERITIGALVRRIGFWGPLYYNYNKEPPKIV